MFTDSEFCKRSWESRGLWSPKGCGALDSGSSLGLRVFFCKRESVTLRDLRAFRDQNAVQGSGRTAAVSGWINICHVPF